MTRGKARPVNQAHQCKLPGTDLHGTPGIPDAIHQGVGERCRSPGDTPADRSSRQLIPGVAGLPDDAVVGGTGDDLPDDPVGPGWFVSMTLLPLISKTRLSSRYTSSGDVATRDNLRGRRKRMIGQGARTGGSGISRRPTWIHAGSRFLGSRKMESPPEDEAMMTRCVPFQMPRHHAFRTNAVPGRGYRAGPLAMRHRDVWPRMTTHYDFGRACQSAGLRIQILHHYRKRVRCATCLTWDNILQEDGC
jgi:hypothetical protein